MTTWELVAEKTKDLPPEKQQQVLDFVEFVRSRREAATSPACPPRKWRDIGGLAPDLLAGEDAQEWVSRTRAESDRQRESAVRRTP